MSDHGEEYRFTSPQTSHPICLSTDTLCLTDIREQSSKSIKHISNTLMETAEGELQQS